MGAGGLLAVFLLFLHGTLVLGADPVWVVPAPSATYNLLESAPDGELIVKLSADDTDGDALTYSLVTSPTEFELTGPEGDELRVKTGASLDYETTTSYTLTVSVTDLTTTVTETLTVSITNENDETPTITSSASYTGTVQEGQNPGAAITFGLTFDDADLADVALGDKLTYSLEGTDSSVFSIDSQTGGITTAQILDRETKSVYNQLVIKVSDAASPAHTATASLTVNVADINDVTPHCTPAVYTTTVDENTAAGNSLVTITCNDEDDGVNGAITYSIFSGNTGGPFQLVTNELQTDSTPTDYESTKSYQLIIHVVDTPASGTPNTGTATVIVTVTGVNEATPAWATWTPGYGAGSITIPEDSAIGTSIVTISATDADDGNDGAITYSLDSVVDSTSAAVAGVFRMDPVSGQLSTLQTLDLENGAAPYTVTVKAEDGGGTPNSITRTYTVSLSDVNDNYPVLTSSTYFFTRSESASASGSLTQFTATDADSSTTFTYSVGTDVVGNLASKLQFNTGTSGQLDLASGIDLDTGDDSYGVITVLVEDGGTNPGPKTGTATVTLTITPTNDHTPAFAATVPATSPIPLSEQASIGTSVATVSATDNDYGADGTVTFSITAGNTGNAFTIVSTGNGVAEIRTFTALDYDGGTTSYALVVTATDGGTNPSPKSSSITVSVDLSNQNDNTPTCTNYYIAVTVAEPAAVNDPVASLSCNDADGDTLTYTISSGNTGSTFAIDSGTGAITLANTVDYDSATQDYTLQVSVTDSTNSQTVTVKVDVTAVNEDNPAFASNPIAGTVSESEAAGYSVYTYAATDADYSPHGITKYEITAVTQSGSSLFIIDQSSGVISLRAPLDYDSLPAGTKFYELTVVATDGGGLTGTGTVTVSVGDVNDNAPSCTQSSWSPTVLENVAAFPNTVIASLGCTDVESTTLTYALTQSPGSLFSVASGGIQQDSAVDYETASSHVLTVQVSDTAGLTTTVVVNIIVQNVNEGPPAFGGPYDVTISEDVVIGTSVADVSATDPDGSTHAFGNPQHSIISGDPSSQFNIDSTTGRVSTRAALNAESASTYSLVVKALELGGTNSATVTLTVTVSDVNDVTPSCTPAVFAETVNEPGTTGDTVLTLTCTDTDVTATTLTYTISSGDTSKFTMNSNVLELAGALDYDGGTTRYDLTITVSDGTNSVDVVGSVTVAPVNEAPPVFSQTIYSVTKSEALAVGGTVAAVTATDGDSSSTADGVVIYDFVTPYPQFTLDSATGVIVLSSGLDRETAATHTLLVTATDSATTVTATVSVTVSDENDNDPVFSAATYTATVSEADAAPAAVVTVAATDLDDSATNGNGAVTFSAVIAGTNNNHFAIDTSTGAITTTQQLDADAFSSYSLTVTAVDRAGGAGSRSSTAVVLVTVTSENQHDPVFSQATYSQTTDEDQPVGFQLVQVSATDADSGSDGAVTYSMATHAKFALASDGWISIKTALDFETTPNTYSFDVVATDGGATPRVATATVSITVGDVNDNTAVCTTNILTSQKREDATGNVATLSCTDADTGTNAALLYTIESVDGVAGTGAFSVDGAGAVSVSSLDYETATSHAVVIKVADQGTTPRSTSVYLTLTVTDVNENDPSFSGTPFSANVAEDGTLGDTVLTVAASGNDGSDTVTYSLSNTSYFDVDAISGAITLKAQLDFETTPAYSVDVCATDSNPVDATRSACESVAITVTDANDNDPVFNPGVYSASVDENKANGVTVTTVTATDADALASGGTVTFSIASGNTGNVFRVDATSGVVIVDDNTALDYETVTSFSLTVRASDGGGRTDDAVVTITVNPINEGTPTFTPASFTLPSGVDEDTAVDTTVHTITATDTDSGADGTLTYSISSGASGKFSIHPTTGEIKLVAALDRETTQSYTLQILAVDGGASNPSPKTGTYALTIDVNDVNDVTPSCSLTYYSASISENAAATASVKDLSCSDGDLDPANLNNDLTYSITAGDTGGLFVVDAAGSVTVAGGASFDRETTPSYTLTLEVVDKATTGKLTATVSLQVDISDENDNTPAFASNPYTPSIAENAALGNTVVQVVATDADIGSNAVVTYSLVTDDPNDPGKFTVDASTGDITVSGTLDFESFSAYVLEVTATDQGTPPLTGSTTVSITITDVDDNPPVCVSSVYTATLAEDANPASATVVTVSCPDADTPGVTYSLSDTHFAVNGGNGVVTLTSALDYETAQSHTLTITASDGTRTDTTIVQVTVTDVNEFPPVFDPTTPYTATVAEDEPIGFTVKDVGATDGDLSDTALTFSITGGNADNKFTIDSATGVIQLQGTLDREMVSSYSLTLEVTDPRSPTATTSIDITVSDVNDNDPACTPNVYVASVAEDTASGGSVVTLTCADVDPSSPTLAFTLLAAGNTGTAFAVDSSTGEITVAAALDYETLTNYNLQVEVSDQGSPTARTVTVPVTVSVTPVNEHDPAFPVGGYPTAVDVPEDSAVGHSVFTVAATDADTGLLHGTVRYSIVGGVAQGEFSIDTSTGLISVAKPLDREATPSYSLTVRASDDVAGSANERTANVVVSITITDVNDNHPVFNPAFYSTTILETATAGGTVQTVTVSDDDAGTNAAVTISIVSGNTGTAFSVSGMDIVQATALDFETTSSYVLVLEATDGGSPALTSQAKLTINVGPVNEDPPVLTDTNFSDTISETTPIGTLIYTATASDADQGGNNDGSITYAITAGDTYPQSFIVDPSSGEVRVFSQLDYDTAPQSYTLTLQASDGGGMTDTVTLNLALSDENDHTPQFTLNTYTTTLDENVANTTSVITVTANDNDSGANGQVTYSIIGGNGQPSFAIDGTTGEITTAAAIDYELVPVLYLVVKAEDAGATPLSSTALVRINVNDLNDNTPVVVPDDYTVTVSESVGTGASVAAVAATDADSSAGNNNVIVYGLTSTDFQVDANTGVVTTVNALDRETTASYVLQITATDQGANPGQNTATATVTVIVTDVNDNDPVITSTHDLTVAEDQPVGSIQLTVTATDADDGENARLTYAITGGNTNNDWNIIASNGMIQIANALDRETTASYLLEVTVSDNGATPRSATVTATVTIGDVNDNDPVFTGTPYSFSVAENSIVGVSVGQVAATDADTGINANLVFSAVNYWTGDNSHFSLDAATGEWTTAVASLDRETQDTYVIWCRVTDQGAPQRSDNANVTITITDINDNPPVFSGHPYTGSVAENSAVGTSVALVTASDADIGANGAITFTIDTSTAAGTRADTYLQIDPTTGEISVKANIDYETDTSFTFKVKATDGGTPTFTATADVTISVTDVNDNRPAFTQTFYNREVAYAGQCSNSVATPVCNDADSGANGQAMCYMEESTYDYLFAVDVSSCSVTTQSVAAANSRYVISLQCRDSGSPALTAATSATIRVDTFIPDRTVIKFELSISRTDFVAQQGSFLTDLLALIRVSRPSARLELWCVQERSGTATAPATGRRRLLQSAQPVDVMLYAVGDDNTDSQANTGLDKTFMTSDELMALFAADSSGTPSSSITGGSWDYYGIQRVTQYTENNTPWIQTPEGIAVVTTGCVLGLALCVLLIVVIVRCCRKRKRPVTPERVVEEENKPQTKPKPSWMKQDTGGVPDLDRTTKKPSLATAAIAATAFAAYNNRKLSTPTRRLTPPETTKSYEDDDGDRGHRKRSLASPRTVLLAPMDEDAPYPVVNRDFDGRALDPNTGKVYEYNTRTNERRWLESPPSY